MISEESSQGQTSILETFAHRSCAICGSAEHSVIGKKLGKLTGHSFTIVRCKKCNFVFVNPALDARLLIELYDESYYRGRGFDSAATYLSADGAVLDHSSYDNASVARRIEQAAKYFGIQGTDFLDFGCGLGALLKEMSKLGYRAEGLETSSFAVESCSRVGLKVHSMKGTLSGILPGASFDVISMIEVIEHLPEPFEAVKWASERLKPGGMLYIQTGNVDHAFNPVRRLASALKRKKMAGTGKGSESSFLQQCRQAFQPLTWDYFSPEGHVSYFSPATLEILFKRCDLQVQYRSRWSLSGLNLPVALKPASIASGQKH